MQKWWRIREGFFWWFTFATRSCYEAAYLNFHFLTLERQCFLVDQILMSFNYFFRFYEIRKKNKYSILSNSEKSKIFMDASSRISETFNGYKVVRYKNQRKERIILHPIEFFSDLVRHQKHRINCYFRVGKTFTYWCFYNNHNTIIHGRC